MTTADADRELLQSERQRAVDEGRRAYRLSAETGVAPPGRLTAEEAAARQDSSSRLQLSADARTSAGSGTAERGIEDPEDALLGFQIGAGAALLLALLLVCLRMRRRA